MTLSVQLLQERLSTRFPEIEQIDDTVVRFVRSAQNRPFAVCYIDVSSHLPQTTGELDEFQDRVIAKHYFEGRKSLQWSNYLYFVVERDVPSDAKSLIERDRKYARKFVVTEPELDSALSPPLFQVAEGVIDSSILTTWTNILGEANLDQAVLNDDSLPRRIERIEAAFGHASLPAPKAKVILPASQLPFISKLELRNFRRCPLQREFEFGVVTLICGPNGTGKTSLLEAVELLYCGRNQRNPDAGEAYSLFATFADGKTENASNHQPASAFRERNLAWYGQSELRTNTLYQSFSRFNFLNTDAAVGLAASKSNFDEDLSKLLVGPEASKTWREVERTSDELEKKLKELSGIRRQVDLELASINRQLSVSGEVQQESDAVYATLLTTMMEAGWNPPEGDAEAGAKLIVQAVAQLETVVAEAISFNWAGTPLSVATLRDFVRATEGVLKNADELLVALQSDFDQQRAIENRITAIEQRVEAANELMSYFEQGFAERVRTLPDGESEIAKLQIALAGYDPAKVESQTAGTSEMTVLELHEARTVAFAAAEQRLDAARTEYSKFSQLRDRALLLAQNLRDIAAQILETSPSKDECPLCHTEFPAGQLASHMYGGVDADVEAVSQTRVDDVRQNERQVEVARDAVAVTNWLIAACDRLQLTHTESVETVLAKLDELSREQRRLSEVVSRARAEITALAATGLRLERYRQLIEALVSTEVTNVPQQREQVKELCDNLEGERLALVAELRNVSSQVQEQQSLIAELFGAGEWTPHELQSTVTRRREQVDLAKAILARIGGLSDMLPCPESRPLSELLVTVRIVRKLVSDFQSTLANERKTVAVVAEASKRKMQITEQLQGLVPRINRLSEAQAVLKRIRSEFSLPGAMEEALRQNRTAIEEIFRRIHSPAEFSGLSGMTTLIRKDGGGTATLQQVSTGQRAAFALSLFLAQNAQLRSAPPLLLVDDPIAHVDDLNCLSFLDYLREVVITGDRQIVFATANEKLATLFERKFDFLGETDFRRYNLRR